jgi:hypothetical protein
MVAEEQALGDVFHLHVGQVVAQANRRADVERHKPVQVMRLESGAVGRQPPLGVRAELEAVLAPHHLQAPRGVDGVGSRYDPPARTSATTCLESPGTEG